MKRSRSTTETSVGLFAFLDVLMSTMGSLILVLMVVTPQIRKEAVARAAAALKASQLPADQPAASPSAAPLPPKEIVDLNAPLRRKLADLSAQRSTQRLVVEERQLAMAAAEADAQKTHARLIELDERLAATRRDLKQAAAKEKDLSVESQKLDTEMTRYHAQLRTIRGHLAEESTKYAIVAYDGVSGTTRRPILIECTRERITFLQEKISLSPQDLRGATASINPVAAGARALIDYWSLHGSPGDPRPYVLLLIRPSGSVAYYAVRRMLETLHDPFGYELLPDEQTIAVPPIEPEAAAACRAAIDRSVASQRELLMAAGPAGGGLRIGEAGGGAPARQGDAFLSLLKPSLPEKGTVALNGAGDGEPNSSTPPTGTAPQLSPSAGSQSSQQAAAQDAPRQFPGLPSPGASERPPGGTPAGTAAAGDELANDSADEHSAGAPRGVRRRWGTSDSHASIGFEHEVSIQLDVEHIWVGDEPPIDCNQVESSKQLAAAVIAALDREARNWGNPPANFYWVPAIKFVIRPGGNLSYERIRSAIEHYGLVSSIDFRLDNAPPHTPLALPKD